MSFKGSQWLDRIAAECQQALAAIDQMARLIIDAERAHNPGGQITVATPLPAPPAQLGELEQQRSAVILQAREQLRLALGDEAFQRFDEFVQQDFARRIRPIQPGPSAVAAEP